MIEVAHYNVESTVLSPYQVFGRDMNVVKFDIGGS